jgi:hypothetical protein
VTRRARDRWERFFAKARRFELRLEGLDPELADTFVALLEEFAPVVMLVMNEAMARGAASGIAKGVNPRATLKPRRRWPS